VPSGEFADARLVAVYDALNSYGPGTQPEFYRRVARECGARSVVEVGCGTGLITRSFVAEGYDVTGLDPSAPMLDVARARPGAERARWVHGDVGALDALHVRDVDFAFMAGHVAQFFLADDEWRDALRVLHRVLRPGGRLAFESRNPAAREWESWAAAPPAPAVATPQGPVERWTEVDGVSDDGDGGVVVTSRLVFRFANGEERLTAVDLRFRCVAALVRGLGEAGFAVTQAYGDWDRRPLAADSREIVLVAASV
jgi:SAM-dependent methyltransferase